MRRASIAAVSLSALLAVSACGGPEAKDSYESPAELGKALNAAAELGCQEDVDAESVHQFGWANVPCDHMAAGFFESEQKREEVISNSAGSGDWALVGRNWAVFGPQFTIEDLQKKLGGEVREPVS